MINIIIKLLWSVATIMILFSGIYFTFKLKGVQFRFKDMFKSITSKSDKNSISSFETLTMALSARIGVGSLAGVALAIYYGGVGSIFWMWVTALIASSNAYVEAVLGSIYHQKDYQHIYLGGPSYYLDKGLGHKRLGRIYAVLILLAYTLGFLTIQSNTITKSITEIIKIEPIYIGIIIALLTAFIIFSGVKKIATVTSKLVPIMAIGYLLIGLIVLRANITLIPSMIKTIVIQAFNIKALGFGVLSALLIGVQRGIFSNEAGLGTGAIASATSDSPIPSSQGFVQVFGIYVSTLVVCTITAFIIMSSDYQHLNLVNLNGIEITQYAFNYHIGPMGSIMVALTIILFAFSTIVSGYYYGEASLKYLFNVFDIII